MSFVTQWIGPLGTCVSEECLAGVFLDELLQFACLSVRPRFKLAAWTCGGGFSKVVSCAWFFFPLLCMFLGVGFWSRGVQLSTSCAPIISSARVPILLLCFWRLSSQLDMAGWSDKVRLALYFQGGLAQCDVLGSH